jgi:queuine tRNA-ribosyltransferase
VLVSFEIDLRLLEFTLDHSHHFKHYHGYEPAIRSLLNQGCWREGAITWELREGDFNQLIDQEASSADLIYWDAYSPKVNSEMWTLSCFKKLFSKCQNSPHRAASLYTYSRSTPIRTALLAAGFYVGVGQATGLKNETTQASTQIQELPHPLGERWFSRWQRSDTPFPIDIENYDQDEIRLKILNHPQFRTLSR